MMQKAAVDWLRCTSPRSDSWFRKLLSWSACGPVSIAATEGVVGAAKKTRRLLATIEPSSTTLNQPHCPTREIWEGFSA
jgi:hypothetical protein